MAMDSLTKTVVINGVRYISRRRSVAQESDVGCRRCAFYAKKVGHTLLCQSPMHHDLCDFCVAMLRKDWHVWFEPAL